MFLPDTTEHSKLQLLSWWSQRGLYLAFHSAKEKARKQIKGSKVRLKLSAACQYWFLSSLGLGQCPLPQHCHVFGCFVKSHSPGEQQGDQNKSSEWACWVMWFWQLTVEFLLLRSRLSLFFSQKVSYSVIFPQLAQKEKARLNHPEENEILSFTSSPLKGRGRMVTSTLGFQNRYL